MFLLHANKKAACKRRPKDFSRNYYGFFGVVAGAAAGCCVVVVPAGLAVAAGLEGEGTLVSVLYASTSSLVITFACVAHSTDEVCGLETSITME